MAKSFIISDDSVNDRGFRILTAGINLERFKKNPIMLWMHRRDDGWDFTQVLPIGKWENIRKEDGKLLADPVFDENDKFALLIKSKVENDLIRGCSAGINPIEFSTDPKDLEKGQTRATITKSELYEASIVDLPSNRNTVRLFSSTNETEIPTLNNNNNMSEKSEEKQLTFNSEADLLKYMKENFGIQPKAEESKEKSQSEGFSFKSEDDARNWFQRFFGLQPKASKSEDIKSSENNSSENEELVRLKADLQKKETEIQELKTQNENLKKAPGADDKKDTKETDEGKNSSSENEVFSTYASAKATWDAVNSLID